MEIITMSIETKVIEGSLDEEERKIIFDSLHEWLDEMRSDGAVDMMDVYRAMVFVGSVNLIHLQNYTLEEAEEMMEILRKNAFELLDMFGDREGVFEFLSKKEQPTHH